MAEVQTSTAQADVRAEDEAMVEEWFDLLPIEMKLIKYSLGLGIGLLVVFVIIFRVLPHM